MIGGFIIKNLFVPFFIVVFLLASCSLEDQSNIKKAYLAQEDLEKQEEELKKFTFDFKLPTYSPFEVSSMKINSNYMGPRDINLSEDEVRKENPDYVFPELGYYTKEEDGTIKAIIVNIFASEKINFSENDQTHEIITFKNGIEAKYFSRESGQYLKWEEDGVIYHINVGVVNSDGKHIKNAFPKEEIIKIGASFKKY
jgi:hypothetical protein